MEYGTQKERASIFTVFAVLGAFALLTNDVIAQGRPDFAGDPHAQLEAKLDELGGKTEDIDGQVDVLEGKADALEMKADTIEGKLDALPDNTEAITALEAKLDELAAAIANLSAGPVTDPGCAQGVRFIDRGLTVYDCQENLEWEKKTEGNVDDVYTWSQGAPWNFDGTAADYINALNAVGFAGHKDWRLPMVDRDGGTTELETILLSPCPAGPCIDETIFGPTAADDYWSSVASALTPFNAWRVGFFFGSVNDLSKSGGRHVRAVRTGP